MRGIIVKPKPCCGESSGMGKVVELQENPQWGVRVIMCSHCKIKYPDKAKNYYLLEDRRVIQKSRVKILPDDLGEEETTTASEEQTA